MELKEIQDLIKFVAKSGVSEVEIESQGFKIVIKTPTSHEYVTVQQPQVHYAPAPVAIPAATPATTSTPAAAADNSKYITIKSPMIGTFYRSAGPDKPLLVNVGDEIKVGKALCIIEAMKLFNEIESEVSGTIVRVLVDDATPVEYDQPLFLVEPK